MADYETHYHDDGTITYWSVYEQVWVGPTGHISALELAARSQEERDTILGHLEALED